MNRIQPKLATRLNSFTVKPEIYWPHKKTSFTIFDLLERAATVKGLTHVDFNYPDHLNSVSLSDIRNFLIQTPLALNGLAMRYSSDPCFSLGAFTNPDPRVRQKAIELTKRGIDTLTSLGGSIMTIWLGQDGFDYPFQVDYAQIFEYVVEGVKKVANYNPDINISIEYKPYEPRGFSILSDVGSTLFLIKEIGYNNIGITLDFCHMLLGKEQPAASAALAMRYGRLFGIHLNDGYGSRDDGLMIGSVHFIQTLELLYTIYAHGFDGTIYFDTFPTNEDPIKECETNIQAIKGLYKLVERINQKQIVDILSKQDALASQAMIQRLITGSNYSE